MKKYFYIFILLIFSVSCNVSKQYTKKGDELYAMGLYDDAANYYYNAVLTDKNNYTAKQALQKTGNIVLTNKMSQFGKYVTQNNPEQAVFQYRNAQKYYQTIRSVDVELEWPTLYDDVYEDIKKDYINSLYEKGISLMNEKKYDAAEKTFSKISAIDSTFKDVTVLRTVSLVEPMYQHAGVMMKNKNYKEAYRNYIRILEIDPDYKDSRILKEEALQKARTGVGVTINNTNKQFEEVSIHAYEYIISTLVKTKNPFLQIVDRKYLEQFLSEQELGMTGIINQQSAAKAGKLAGLKYVLSIRVSDYKITEIDPKTDSVTAYEAFTESTPNQNGTYNYVTRFKKVNYADTYHKKSFYIRLFYELISTETSQIVTSDVIEETLTDEQHIYKYAGDPKNLYPQLPSENNLPEVSKEWKKNFGEIKRKLTPIDDLKKDAMLNLSLKIANDISIYFER